VDDTDTPPRKKTEHEKDVGLYAPAERYSRDLPADAEGREKAPVVRGADPEHPPPDDADE
jgi:hypothetical protein